MALVVETGTGANPSANSFADLATLKAYLTARGIALPADATIEVAALEAMDYITAKEGRLQGSRVSADQPLCYPRTGVVVFGFDVAADAIPKQLVSAQCRLTADSLSGVDLMPNVTGPQMIREKIGPLDTEWAESDTSGPTLAKAEAFLEPLYQVGGFRLKTYRA